MKHVFGAQWLRWCALLVFALFALGCSSDDAPQRPATLEYELFEHTVELDDATLAALRSADAGQLVFEGAPSQLDGIAPDQFLLGGVTPAAPYGILRRVLAVDASGPDLIVATKPATVFHAFRRLALDTTLPFDGRAQQAVPVAAEAGPGLGTSQQSIQVTLPLGDASFSKVLTDGDGQGSTEDRVEANGKMVATVTFKFWLNFDWADKTAAEALSALDDLLEDVVGLFTGHASLGELLNLKTGFKVEGDFDVLLDIVGKSALQIEREDELANFTVTPPISIGPLVFLPTVSLVSTVGGGITGELQMGFGVGAKVGVGFDYDADVGFPYPFVSGPTFDAIEPSATVSSLASIRAELELRLGLMLFGFAGPYASVSAFGEVDLDRNRTPCWKLEAGLEAGAGASIGVFGRTLASFAVPGLALGDPVELASGACKPPPTPPPTDAKITPWSKSYAKSVWTTGTDDDSTQLELAHDGRLLLTSTGSKLVTKVEENGTPTWTREIARQEGASSVPLRPRHAVPMLDAGILVSTHENALAKLTSSGEALWGVALQSDTVENGFRAMKQIDGRIWLAGAYRPKTGGGTGDRQALLVLLSKDGSFERAWTWGSPDYHEAIRGILPLADGALLVGEAQTFTGSSRSFVLRAEPNGDLRWAKHVEGCVGGEPTLTAATETMDGNLIVSGWYYATHTRALLLRLSAEGSEQTPAWATETSITPILGLEPSSVIQLSTGELRVTGRWAKTPDNRVFVAGADSTGHFAWLETYGGSTTSGPATARITQQGGLLVAATTTVTEAAPGGHWLFEVPMANGAINFAPASGLSTQPLTFTSSASCVTSPDAPTTTSVFALSLESLPVTSRAVTLDVKSH